VSGAAALLEPPADDTALVVAVLRTVRRGFLPPPELRVSEFSDAHIMVTSGPLSGSRWQTSFAPYQKGILDAFHEAGVEIVVVKGSSQWGKTASPSTWWRTTWRTIPVRSRWWNRPWIRWRRTSRGTASSPVIARDDDPERGRQ
jgi:hypothetical protein